LELYRDGKSMLIIGVGIARIATMAALTLRWRAALFRGAMDGLTVVILALVATNVSGQEGGGQADQPRTALYLICKLTPKQRYAFETWHNETFANALENER